MRCPLLELAESTPGCRRHVNMTDYMHPRPHTACVVASDTHVQVPYSCTMRMGCHHQNHKAETGMPAGRRGNSTRVAYSTTSLTDCGPHHCRAAKGVGKKMTAALESLKVGWGGGSGAASPSSGPTTPKGAALSGPSGL